VADVLEVQPTLDAMGPVDDLVICELGCGPGRYTLRLARRASAVVAVDFSLTGLVVIRGKLEPTARVALVQADVTRPYGSPASFDRVLSTLHSNLPDLDHRAASWREVARITADRGRAVISMHHHSLRDRLTGVPVSGRYADSGIYRYYMTVRQSREEAASFFARVHHVPVAVSMPGVPSVAMSRAIARVPMLRRALGRLLLAVGEGPQRDRSPEAIPCA
jgi:SAM-dependent methyltransferase